MTSRPDLDLYDRSFREEREWEIYAELRAQCPVVHAPKMQEWWIVGYDECRSAFKDHELFSNDLTLPAGTGPALVGEKFLPIPVYTDPPEHERYKRLLEPLFSPRAMAALEPAVRTVARDLLDRLGSRSTFDVMVHFAIPFPTSAFCLLMGFPLSDHEQIMWWKDLYLNGSSTMVADRYPDRPRTSTGALEESVVIELKRDAIADIKAYLAGLFAERRAQPRDDLMSRLLDLRHDDGSELSEDELIKISFNLYLGGLDTVSGVLGLAIRDLAEQPDVRRRFVSILDDPSAVATACEELLRFQSIVPMPRRVTRDVEFGGQQLRENDIVSLHTPSADRDERRFDRAAELRLDRSPNPHLGYGLGRHRCLGIHLARLELAVGLEEMHRRFPDYQLTPGVPAVVNTGGMRGLFNLSIDVEGPA